jgi:hypothetical protein
MSKRFAIIVILSLLPFAATADDSASSAGLGPQGDTTSGVSSGADSAALQPAGNAPLQSTTNDASGLGASSSVLQAPATGSGDLQVLSGEADGATHQTSDSAATPWTWLTFSFISAALAAGAVMIFRDRRRFARTQAVPSPADDNP